MSFREGLLARARDLGFAAGIAPPRLPLAALGDWRGWIARGEHAGMASLARSPERRLDAGTLLPGAASVLVVALPHPPPPSAPPAPGAVRIAAFARGDDYHAVFRERLALLAEALQRERPTARWRAFVDTAPLAERAFARAAGLGWIGRHRALVVPPYGSYCLLGGLVTDLPLQASAALEPECGACRRCLEACPTGALGESLDARRCLSYLTIEHRGALPLEARGALGATIFGCDACQRACPANAAPAAPPPLPPSCRLDLAPRRALEDPPLAVLLAAVRASFRAASRGTALVRAGKGGLLRNLLIAAGNQGCAEAHAEIQALAKGEDPILRESALWALGRE